MNRIVVQSDCGAQTRYAIVQYEKPVRIPAGNEARTACPRDHMPVGLMFWVSHEA